LAWYSIDGSLSEFRQMAHWYPFEDFNKNGFNIAQQNQKDLNR
jgi:hypothetical protein